MHRRAVPSLELAHQGASTETFGDESPATPIRSRESLFRTRPEPGGRSSSLLPTSGVLSICSLILHSLLVVIHVILLGTWAKGLEHRVTFSLKHQRIASFLITAISTAIGTVYSALLVFITQTLSMRRSLRREQTLTATHDGAAAWAGIGSAAVQLWSQKAVSASIIGVFGTFCYLAAVLVMHITTPALFSLETFNASRTVPVQTRGVPSFNWSDSPGFDIIDTLYTFLPQPLSQLPSVFTGAVTTLGLHNGTIYDVLATTDGVGNVSVPGTGFNISCGYLPDVTLSPLENTTSWNATWPALAPYYQMIYATQPGLIVPINRTFLDALLFYTTIPVVDSALTRGQIYTLTPPLNNATSTIQIIACSQSRINQTAIVDAQTRKIVPGSLKPELEKRTSTWSAYAGPLDILGGSTATDSPGLNPNTTDNMFLNLWSMWYSLIPTSDFPLVVFSEQMLSLADLRLNQLLNTVAFTDRPQNVSLHALENAVSTIVAAMFWTLGNIPPSHGFIVGTPDADGHIVNAITDLIPAADLSAHPTLELIFNRPFLLTGSADVTVVQTETRLDLSIIAVVTGLFVSALLFILSLPSSLFSFPRFRRGSGGGGGSAVAEAAELSIEGTGLLHAIWLFRAHPELEPLLRQVAHPTQENLRRAGMLRTKLVGADSGSESFLMMRRSGKGNEES
ncbi:hypothetical protein DFH06DRAFT_261292 [Mycena polygramma]|nr:hypothetical protein DFH06DRAFT_261292 [Mycena polygramma]